MVNQSDTTSEDPVPGLYNKFKVLAKRESPRDQLYVPETPKATQSDHSITVPIIG